MFVPNFSDCARPGCSMPWAPGEQEVLQAGEAAVTGASPWPGPVGHLAQRRQVGSGRSRTRRAWFSQTRERNRMTKTGHGGDLGRPSSCVQLSSDSLQREQPSPAGGPGCLRPGRGRGRPAGPSASGRPCLPDVEGVGRPLARAAGENGGAWRAPPPAPGDGAHPGLRSASWAPRVLAAGERAGTGAPGPLAPPLAPRPRQYLHSPPSPTPLPPATRHYLPSVQDTWSGGCREGAE